MERKLKILTEHGVKASITCGRLIAYEVKIDKVDEIYYTDLTDYSIRDIYLWLGYDALALI